MTGKGAPCLTVLAERRLFVTMATSDRPTSNTRHLNCWTGLLTKNNCSEFGPIDLCWLYAVLKGISVVREDYQNERIYIAFRPKDRRFEVADAAIRRDPEFIPDISQL
jgi:hypothetical protein